MDKSTTNRLARFCVEQSQAFNTGDWFDLNAVDEKVIVLAARYLSMTSWYGHEEDLSEIVEHMQISGEPPESTTLCNEAQALEFDLSYFSAVVRGGIARNCQANAVGGHGRLH
jgi:hypothetical protein